MSAFRVASRVPRNLRVQPVLRQLRHESTNPSSSSSNGGISPGIIGGVVGGGLVFIGGYTYYHFSGAKTIVNTAHQAQNTFKSYSQKIKSSSPDFEPNEAIEWLRSTAKSYAGIIPGASGYIDSAFDDIDAIRAKHAKEVDSIVKEAYNELKDVSQEGMTITAATKAWEILQKHLKRIGELAGDAAQDIINNHPALKEKVGGNLDQLKQMGDKYGPEAKKQVDETWEQIREIMKTGVSATTIPKIQKLVQDKVQKIQELGSKVWDQGMEKAQPLLDKSPEVKDLVQKNADQLKKSASVSELYEKIKSAVDSGSTDDLKSYVQSTVDKAKKSTKSSGGGGGGLENLLKTIPGGSEIMPKLGELQQLAQEHGEEAEKIAKDTFGEIEGVLKKKIGEARELAKKAGKQAKGE
ncbi:hypothetical protein JMJ35_002734 [Cladonia borealis]|uniref:Apolipoprotein/apolipophorin n=1 Tax=Cladonia borealis TaxID=184061 RepID=A0AA39V9F2_9LECA|nr:hypothetical protein JMJ35_002734 [Cladonia borealis]